MNALLAAVDAKDTYTRAHSIQVAAYADALAVRLGLREKERSVLRIASLLHDIGKIGVPDRILNKPGKLTEEEFCVMRCHPRIAVNILQAVRGFRRQCEIILHHHERYNGQGYPARLCGEEIPLGARILSAADAVDTMLARRTYKCPMTTSQVQTELARQAGVQFDPKIVALAIHWIDDGGIEQDRVPT